MTRRPTATSNVLDLITPWFAEAAARTAVVDRNERITYRELDRRSRAIAAALRSRPEPATAVVLHARLAGWAIAAMVGALRAGVRYVPVDTAFPPDRQRLLYTASGAGSVLREPGLPDPGWPDPDSSARAQHADSAAYTCFTSGSTGTPKRIDVPVAALAYSTAARLAYYVEPIGRFLLCSSISFDSAVAGIYWTLASGGTLVVPSDRAGDLMAIARAAESEAATHMLLVPSQYRLLLNGPLTDRLRTLTTVIVAGEAVPPSLVGQHLARLPGAALFNEYGPTECTVWSTVHSCTAADAAAPTVPIGLPIPGCRVSVHDRDGTPVADGERGELWIAGPGVAAPTTDDIYRTGDLGRIRPDGVIEFHGRVDDQLKLGGARIELGEIEHVLASQEGVLAAAVGVADRHGEHPTLIGFVVPACSGVDVQRIRSDMLRQLPAAAVPRRVVMVNRLPTQPNGKVDRKALDNLGLIQG